MGDNIFWPLYFVSQAFLFWPPKTQTRFLNLKNCFCLLMIILYSYSSYYQMSHRAYLESTDSTYWTETVTKDLEILGTTASMFHFYFYQIFNLIHRGQLRNALYLLEVPLFHGKIKDETRFHKSLLALLTGISLAGIFEFQVFETYITNYNVLAYFSFAQPIIINHFYIFVLKIYFQLYQSCYHKINSSLSKVKLLFLNKKIIEVAALHREFTDKIDLLNQIFAPLFLCFSAIMFIFCSTGFYYFVKFSNIWHPKGKSVFVIVYECTWPSLLLLYLCYCVKIWNDLETEVIVLTLGNKR